jgi:hypothetical protein
MLNMRGDNTCFSGLGGVNCQEVANWLGSIVALLLLSPIKTTR